MWTALRQRLLSSLPEAGDEEHITCFIPCMHVGASACLMRDACQARFLSRPHSGCDCGCTAHWTRVWCAGVSPPSVFFLPLSNPAAAAVHCPAQAHVRLQSTPHRCMCMGLTASTAVTPLLFWLVLCARSLKSCSCVCMGLVGSAEAWVLRIIPYSIVAKWRPRLFCNSINVHGAIRLQA